MIPPLLRQLIDSGNVQPQEFKARAVFSACTRCGRRVFCQADEFIQGHRIMADAEPISQVGEATARSMNLDTYELHGVSRYVMSYRTAWDIMYAPAGKVFHSGNQVMVVVQHVCYAMMGTQYRMEFQ